MEAHGGGKVSEWNRAINETAKVYQLLEDEISKEIYLTRLKFLVTKNHNV